MNPNDDDLTPSAADAESLLRGLSLRSPSTALDDRIAASRTGRRVYPMRWAAVAAAAVLFGAGVAFRTARTSHVPMPIARVAPSPVSVERDVSQTIEDGVITVAGQAPYRQLRHRTVREIWWTDPATGARLWAQLPDERVTVEPAETF